MCTTCTTLFDLAATNVALGAVVASNRWERFQDARRGISRLERELRTWESNAAFVRSMGLEPLAVIGAPPAVPVLPVTAAADAEVAPPAAP